MKLKRLLRFYFSAEELNKTMDKFIINLACKSAEGARAAEYYAAKIIKLTQAKGELNTLYSKLDGVLSKMSGRDIEALRFYGLLRTGVKNLPMERYREVHRATVKFHRRISGKISEEESCYKILAHFSALI